jgi:hypothetical protein
MSPRWFRALLLPTLIASFAMGVGTGCDVTPVQSCQGEALSCAGLDEVSCVGQLGCDVQLGECSGFSSPCSSHFDEFTCGDQPGCFWSFSLSICDGSAEACSLQSSDFSCTRAQGCSWTPPSCSGAPLACDDFESAQICSTQLGCIWE